MNLCTLGYYVEVCRTGSLHQAAERLSLSRQALSKSILMLERELDVQLLIRKKSGVGLTQAGEALFRHAVLLLEEWDHTLQDIDAIRTPAREVLRVGYGQMTYNLWDSSHVEAFAQAHPNLDVSCQIMLPDQLRQALVDGDLDLMISSSHETSPLFSNTLLYRLPLCAILRSDDPLVSRGKLQLSDLDHRIIFHIRGHSSFSSRLRRVLAAAHIDAELRPCLSETPFTILRSVHDSGGIYFTSTLHLFYPNALEGLTVLPFVHHGPLAFPSRDIYATTLCAKAGNPAVSQYIRYLAAKKIPLP